MVDIDVFVHKTILHRHLSMSFRVHTQLSTTMFDPDELLQYSTFRSYTDRHLNCYTAPDDAFDRVLFMSSSARQRGV